MWVYGVICKSPEGSCVANSCWLQEVIRVVAMLEAFAVQPSVGAGSRIMVYVSLALPSPKRKEAWIDLTLCYSCLRSNTSLSQEKRKLQRRLSYVAFLLEIGLFTPSRLLGQRWCWHFAVQLFSLASEVISVKSRHFSEMLSAINKLKNKKWGKSNLPTKFGFGSHQW